ncbi:MAG: hypothetical protein AAF547_06140 [Actinomycetota bacterium]
MVAGGATGGGDGDRSNAGQVTDGDYVLVELTEFRQLDGQPQWAELAQARLATATWSFDGGSFVFDPPDVRTDLFPLRGSVEPIDGGGLRFEAAGFVTDGTNSQTESTIFGTIRPADGGLLLQATWMTSGASAAVVNGAGFGSSSVNAYEFAGFVG